MYEMFFYYRLNGYSLIISPLASNDKCKMCFFNLLHTKLFNQPLSASGIEVTPKTHA